MSFKDRLRIARKAQNLTQDDLATLLQARGVRARRTAVNSWETGKHEPNAATLKIIADVLNISVDDLLGNPATQAENLPVEPTQKYPPMLTAFLDRLAERPEQEQAQTILLGCLPADRLEQIHKLASLPDDDLARICALADLDPTVLNALCVLGNIKL